MHRAAVLAVALLCAESVVADYTQFYFPTKSNQFFCAGMGNTCPPPSVCAHESLTDVHYCCGSGSQDAVCWTNSQNCRGDDAAPASGQLGCPSNANANAYCCRSGREQCTQRRGQINICWALPANPLANISSDAVNATYSSISSASASAKTLTVSLAQLSSSSATATPISTPASSLASTTGSSTTGSPTALQTSTTPDNKSSNISGGAIGGIVVGAVAFIALVGILAFILFRRRKAKRDNASEMDGAGAANPYASNGYSAVANGEQVKYAHDAPPSMVAGDEAGGQQMQYAPVEMPAEGYHGAATELEGHHHHKTGPIAQLP